MSHDLFGAHHGHRRPVSTNCFLRLTTRTGFSVLPSRVRSNWPIRVPAFYEQPTPFLPAGIVGLQQQRAHQPRIRKPALPCRHVERLNSGCSLSNCCRAFCMVQLRPIELVSLLHKWLSQDLSHCLNSSRFSFSVYTLVTASHQG